jgi:fructokinase
MTDQLVRGAPLAAINEAGNRWGAWVASQAGGMPELSEEAKSQVTGGQ